LPSLFFSKKKLKLEKKKEKKKKKKKKRKKTFDTLSNSSGVNTFLRTNNFFSETLKE